MASQAAVKHMAKHVGGSIINFSSVGGLVPDISQVAYGTSKAAINYLTKLIAVQEAKNHIRCNAVLPGMTATDAVEKNLSHDFCALFMRHIPLARMGQPDEIADAVCYFASDASAYTTGQILAVSGGFGLATPVYGDLVRKQTIDKKPVKKSQHTLPNITARSVVFQVILYSKIHRKSDSINFSGQKTPCGY